MFDCIPKPKTIRTDIVDGLEDESVDFVWKTLLELVAEEFLHLRHLPELLHPNAHWLLRPNDFAAFQRCPSRFDQFFLDAQHASIEVAAANVLALNIAQCYTHNFYQS